MAAVQFGTDGVRGVANADLSVETVTRLGRAVARALREAGTDDGGRPTIIVGRDTRRSGPMLEAALAAGLAAEGFDVVSVGVIPTPAVAYLVRRWQAWAGAVISASHNPAQDNGIKFFSNEGFKLPEEVEKRIEALFRGDASMVSDGAEGGASPLIGAAVGTVIHRGDGESEYLNYLLQTMPADVGGWKIVIDCAHGAASFVAPKLFAALGCQVEVLHAQPDGMNINAGCGSTHPEVLQDAVRRSGAALGLAFDGDADRLIAVDERGNVVDGDAVLAICAEQLLEEGKLAGNAIAATVYSNLGLVEALGRLGVDVMMTGAGDRAVLEAMLEHGLVLGGEQSGHIIFREHATTGDGLVSALQLMAAMAARREPLSHLAGRMTRFPQVLKNVPVAGSIDERKALVASEPVQEAIARGEAMLRPLGRIFVRPSGTEPLVRVMGEGKDAAAVEAAVKEVVAALEALGAEKAPGLSATTR